MVFINMNSTAPFHDKLVEKIVVDIAKEYKLTTADVRRMIRCYFTTIRNTINEWPYENEQGDINVDKNIYIRVPYLFAFKTSKYRLQKAQDKKVANDKKSI